MSGMLGMTHCIWLEKLNLVEALRKLDNNTEVLKASWSLVRQGSS